MSSPERDLTPESASPTDIAPLGHSAEKPPHEKTGAEEAASFLGIAGMVAFNGYDGFMYSVGFLVAWLTDLLVVAEPLRNAGKYTMADVLAYCLKPRPLRAASSLNTLTVSLFYMIAQMVGADTLVRREVFFAFISAVAFATILAAVAGLTISASTSFAHDFFTNVIHHGREHRPGEEVRVARATAFVVGALANSQFGAIPTSPGPVGKKSARLRQRFSGAPRPDGDAGHKKAGQFPARLFG